MLNLFLLNWAPDTDLKLEVLTPQRLFQYKKRLAEAKRAQARSHFGSTSEPGGSEPGGDPRLLSPNAALAIPDTIQAWLPDGNSQILRLYCMCLALWA